MSADHYPVEAYNSPFDFAGKTAVCLPLDFQLNDLVYKTGHEGSTLKVCIHPSPGAWLT